jgi:hypothetical protein
MPVSVGDRNFRRSLGRREPAAGGSQVAGVSRKVLQSGARSET